MTNQTIICRRFVPVVRWVARTWAGLLFLFWGAFFVEHTAEWFAQGGDWPPLHVSLLHAAHFLMLIGFVIGWRWELLGGALAIAGAILFFPQVAGKNAALFLIASVGPAILWIGLECHSIAKCSSAASTTSQQV